MLISKLLVILIIIIIIYIGIKVILNLPEIQIFIYGKDVISKKKTAKNASQINIKDLKKAETTIKTFKKSTKSTKGKK